MWRDREARPSQRGRSRPPDRAPIAGADPQVTAALLLATCWAGWVSKADECREPAARPGGAVAELGRPLAGLRHPLQQPGQHWLDWPRS